MERRELQERLERIGANARRELRRVRIRRAAFAARERALPLLVIGPAIILGLQLMRFAVGAEAFPFGLLPILGLTLALMLLWISAGALQAAGQAVDDRDALAVADAELDLSDRLLTAHEFLRLPHPSPFMQAALDDAEEHARLALERALALAPPTQALTGRVWGLAIAGVLLAMIAGRVALWTYEAAADTQDTEVAAVDGHALPPTETREESEEAPVIPEVLPESAPAVASATPEREQTAKNHERSADVSEDAKKSEGETGSGKSADAQSASGASQSRGAPSGQAQASKPPEKKPKKGKDPKKKPGAKPEGTPKKQPEEQSGSTAGKGSSKGSNKNPAASSWSSKDQVTTQDDQEIEDDEETEDEEEDQEARGGVQPSLRDRKPPVSRDLRIGFGNQPNPDANGRGGPSQAKKSRGTASLVLGVPIPDRVKGQPNPGKTKITQERIEPKAEESDPLDAQPRRPRATPVGHTARPELAPWMRDLVRTYFLTIRKESKDRS